MMKTVYLFLIGTLLLIDPSKIGKINSAKAEAKKAYLSGDFKTAIQKYSYLIDSLGVTEDEVRANLASAYFQLNDTAKAQSTYQQLTQSPNKRISSVANQQLGVIANNKEKLEEALSYFKSALKAAPENNEARYNYEVVKKKLEEKEKKKKEDEKKDSKNDKDIPPSEFAKKLKAQADELVRQQLYKQAFDLMQDGLKKDRTVAHYNKFIERTKIVSTINK